MLGITAGWSGRARAEDDRVARKHYQKGVLHYDLGEFDQAIAEFRQAYALSPAPALLFDLGQAHRLKHDPERALHFYRAYLRAVPDAKNRADAQGWIDRLQAQVQPTGPQPAPHAAAARTPEPPKPADRSLVVDGGGASNHGRAAKAAGTVMAAGGLALFATAIYFGHQAQAAEGAIAELAAHRGQWDAPHQLLYEGGQRAATRAQILYLAGGAAMATGGLLYLVGWQKDRLARRLAVVPAPAGGALALTGTF